MGFKESVKQVWGNKWTKIVLALAILGMIIYIAYANGVFQKSASGEYLVGRRVAPDFWEIGRDLSEYQKGAVYKQIPQNSVA